MKKHLITKRLDALNILSDTAVIYGFLKLFPPADPRHSRARQHRDMPKQSRHFHLFKTYMASIQKFPLSFSQWHWREKIVKIQWSSHTPMLHLLNSHIFRINILLIIYYSCLAGVSFYWCTPMPAWLRVGIHFVWYLETKLEVM